METISKNVLIESLSSMPEEVDVEVVIEQIILLSKIERARQQIIDGQYSSQEDVKEQYKEWLE